MEFDGTPEEFKKVGHLFAPQEAALEQSLNEPPASDGTTPALAQEEETAIPIDIAERALTRIPLSVNQNKAFAAVLAAGPDGILISDLAAKMGITRPQLAGVFGSLGRRFANTPGWPSGGWLINEAWDANHSEYKFWAHPTLKEVVQRGTVRFSE
jgi:hypothetical protein